MTLAVARRLKAALEGRLGVRVILTRDGDADRWSRPACRGRQQQQGGPLHHLHANASVRPSAAGAEVFFLSLDEYGEEAHARRVGAARNATGVRRRKPRHRGRALAVRAGPSHRALGDTGADGRSVVARPRPMNPRALQAGTVARAGWRQHAGCARRDGVHDQPGAGETTVVGRLSERPRPGAVRSNRPVPGSPRTPARPR